MDTKDFTEETLLIGEINDTVTDLGDDLIILKDRTNKLIRTVNKQEALIETLKKMHKEDKERIEALEKWQEKVESVYPFGKGNYEDEELAKKRRYALARWNHAYN